MRPYKALKSTLKDDNDIYVRSIGCSNEKGINFAVKIVATPADAKSCLNDGSYGAENGRIT